MTSSCVESTKASIASRTGLNQRPSYTISVQRCSSGRFSRASSFVSTDVLERRVRGDERHRARRLVHLAALDADSAVLDHVDPADPVGTGKTVGLCDELGERELLAVERHRDALLEADDDLDRCRRARWVGGERVRLLGRRGPRILEDAGLDRAAEEVLVDRVRRRSPSG